MKLDNFLKAMTIMSENHDTKIVINHVNKNGQVSPILESPTIQIIDCCGAVINALKKSGFSLSMQNGMMSIDDFAIK